MSQTQEFYDQETIITVWARGSGKMGHWVIGKTTVDREVYKWHASAKNQHSNIPPFHYSMREARNRDLENLLHFQ